jgi:hypothetical protein
LSVAHRDVGDHCLWIERPARVVMTGFPAAYYPSMKTVGAFRDQVRVERSNLPEDVGAATESTPYRRDVFLLGAERVNEFATPDIMNLLWMTQSVSSRSSP